MSVKLISVSKLSLFDDNPRYIKTDDFEDLKRNMLQDPDFFHQRCCLVNKIGDKLTIYAGNQRYRAAVELGWTDIPCIVEEDLPLEVMRKRSLLDNHTFGKWDVDVLANSWDIDELLDIGQSLMSELKIPDLANIGEDLMGEDDDPSGDNAKPYIIKYELIFDNEQQQDTWHAFLKHLKSEYEGETIAERLTLFLNQNVFTNG